MNDCDSINIVPLKYEYCEQVYEIAKKYLPEAWSLDGIRDVLQYDNNIYYVAQCVKKTTEESDVIYKDDSILGNGGNIIGFGGIMIVADEAELLNIAVEDCYRGIGVASSIIDRLISDAKNAKCVRMLLEVRSANDCAQHLYRKKYFAEIGTRKDYYSNPVDDAIIMERVL